MTSDYDWNGRVLSQGSIALFMVPSCEQTEPALAVAGAGPEHVIVPAGRLGEFLRAHAACELSAYNAASLHWMLDGHFRRTGDAVALDVLWSFSHDRRLHDIGLLDQLVRLAEEGGYARTS